VQYVFVECRNLIQKVAKLDSGIFYLDNRSTRTSDGIVYIDGDVNIRGQFVDFSCEMNGQQIIESATLGDRSIISSRKTQSISEYAFE
jgi:hypothetical protein